MALGHGVYDQTAEPSDSLWAATVQVSTGRGAATARDNVERAGETFFLNEAQGKCLRGPLEVIHSF